MGKGQFILGSKSKARRLLLISAGIHPVVIDSDFDETSVESDNPVELVETLALCKAESVAARVWRGEEGPQPLLVLGCDSVLSLAGEIHGKPANSTEAEARWRLMRQNVGELYTGHALIDVGKRQTVVRCQVTRVFFADISDREIAEYVATGEPLQCAGCFAIDGRGGLFVEKIEGCHTNVIGLSLPLLRRMVAELGYNITDFW
ncbi:nucleoside triphosphate pyrophosphatase [[Phormidium] sp. ETS-05]|uniref:Maf family protein n=1 Tax=[Phormidium] sp. ETS-05 TaxID=222819 RepID=UPI0018EEF31E|nr:nucleoside triphosphate pyrophosphatase [[Phormidium] sp. ETS-05]